jgi:flagellar assembly protein FliH
MSTTQSRRVLKADTLRGLGMKVAFNYEDLRESCEQHLERIRVQTRTMLQDAATEGEVIRVRSHEDGFAEGREAGLIDADAEIERRTQERAEQMVVDKLNSLIPAMHEAAEALLHERDQWRAEWEAIGVRLSIAIAKKLIRKEFDADPEAAHASFAAVLELAAGQPRVSIRMHPNDIALLGEHADEVAAGLASCAEAIVTPDESMMPGGCFIETQHGIIDGRIDTQLNRIASELLESDV